MYIKESYQQNNLSIEQKVQWMYFFALLGLSQEIESASVKADYFVSEGDLSSETFLQFAKNLSQKSEKNVSDFEIRCAFRTWADIYKKSKERKTNLGKALVTLRGKGLNISDLDDIYRLNDYLAGAMPAFESREFEEWVCLQLAAHKDWEKEEAYKMLDLLAQR